MYGAMLHGYGAAARGRVRSFLGQKQPSEAVLSRVGQLQQHPGPLRSLHGALFVQQKRQNLSHHVPRRLEEHILARSNPAKRELVRRQDAVCQRAESVPVHGRGQLSNHQVD